MQCCEPGLEWLWEKGGTFDRTGYCIEMLNFFLAASGVSDGMCDLWLWHTDSLVVVLRLWHTVSVVATLRLSCSIACEIFP